MFTIMKTLVLTLSLIASLTVLECKSQALYIRDYNGRIITPDVYADIKGSPYLSDSWHKGFVKFSNGTTYKDVELKFDQVKGQVLYRKPGDEEVVMSFGDPVEEFLISDVGTSLLSRDKYFIKDKQSTGFAGSIYYEVLFNGATKLLKRSAKYVTEQSQYNSATKTKVIDEKFTYYLLSESGDKIEVKKDKKSLIAAMGNKKDVVEAYINDKKLNLKNEGDLINLVTYYNTL